MKGFVVMEKIALFEKVSRAVFAEAAADNPLFENTGSDKIYDDIAFPRRATKGSAGYDFFSPCDIDLKAGETILIPTGIRAKIAEGWVLMMFPRSGLGFKYRIRLENTVGIIDSDYYGADNEGHIMIKMTNEGSKEAFVKKGSGFAQGIFLPYGITADDEADALRTGGFGSTG